MNAKGVYCGIASNIVGNLLMLGATLWLTRILDPAQFGQFRVGANFAVLMVPFLALGGERLLSRLIQSKPLNDPSIPEAIASVLGVVGIGAVLLVTAYPLLSRSIFDGNIPLGVYYLSIALIPITIAYNLANTLWRHIGSAADAQVHLNFTQRMVRAPLLVGLSLVWPSALMASLAMLVAQAFSLFRIRSHLLRFSVCQAGSLLSAVRGNLRELFVIGLPVAFMAAIDRLDVLLINAVMGVERAGSYDLVFMLSLTAMFPAMAMSKTSEPFLYALAADRERQGRLRQLQSRAFLLSCLALLGILVAAPVLERFLGNAGPDFSDAALVLAAGLAFSSVYGPVVEYLQINGKAKLALATVAASVLFFFPFKYWAATADSLVGVAGLAGLLYFSLRAVLSLHIYITDGVVMAPPRVVLLSFLGYVSVTASLLHGSA